MYGGVSGLPEAAGRQAAEAVAPHGVSVGARRCDAEPRGAAVVGHAADERLPLEHAIARRCRVSGGAGAGGGRRDRSPDLCLQIDLLLALVAGLIRPPTVEGSMVDQLSGATDHQAPVSREVSWSAKLRKLIDRSQKKWISLQRSTLLLHLG